MCGDAADKPNPTRNEVIYSVMMKIGNLYWLQTKLLIELTLIQNPASPGLGLNHLWVGLDGRCIIT